MKHCLKANTIVIQFNKEYHIKWQQANINKKPSSQDLKKIKKHSDDLLAIRLDDKDELLCFLSLLYDEQYIAIYDNNNESYLPEHFKNNSGHL